MTPNDNDKMHDSAERLEMIIAIDLINKPYNSQSINAVQIKYKVGKEMPSCFFLIHTSFI